MSKIYIVTWTIFLDDYKLRGNEPSTSIEPALFSKCEYAKEYLASLIRDYLEDCGYGDSFIKETFPECIDEEENGVVSFDSFDFPVLENMLERVNKGEFVPHCVSWSIKEQALDTKRVDPPKKKHKII